MTDLMTSEKQKQVIRQASLFLEQKQQNNIQLPIQVMPIEVMNQGDEQ